MMPRSPPVALLARLARRPARWCWAPTGAVRARPGLWSDDGVAYREGAGDDRRRRRVGAAERRRWRRTTERGESAGAVSELVAADGPGGMRSTWVGSGPESDSALILVAGVRRTVVGRLMRCMRPGRAPVGRLIWLGGLVVRTPRCRPAYSQSYWGSFGFCLSAMRLTLPGASSRLGTPAVVTVDPTAVPTRGQARGGVRPISRRGPVRRVAPL